MGGEGDSIALVAGERYLLPLSESRVAAANQNIIFSNIRSCLNGPSTTVPWNIQPQEHSTCTSQSAYRNFSNKMSGVSTLFLGTLLCVLYAAMYPALAGSEVDETIRQKFKPGKPVKEQEYYLGIDLGTTTTLAAFMTENHPRPEFVSVRYRKTTQVI